MFLKHIKTDITFRKSTRVLYASLFFLFLFNALFTKAVVKSIGVPTIQNYPRSEYNAGTQNWSVQQGTNGVMYFGNNNGLLRFDGQFWDLHLMPNGSNIRVLHFSENQQLLYAGAYDEFGYFSNDSTGRLVYHSLLPLVAEEDLNFGDVWKIYEGSWGVVFQTFEGLFFYKDGQIEVVKPRSDFHYSYYVNGILYVFDRETGLLEYRNGFLKKIPSGDFFKRKEVWSMLPLNNDEILIGTAKEGLFHYDGMKLKPWDTPVNGLLKKYQIYSSLIVDNNHLAFGTIQNGLIICNKQGEVVQIVNREKGLQNNTVLSMCLDLDGNMWLGLDNGIDYVEINSPITLLQDYYDFGTGYTSILYKNTIYLGTNQGLFYCNKDKLSDPFLNATDFKMVPNTSGQVWSLQVINGKLFCGHNNGAFLIENNVGNQINEIPGCWAFHEIPGYSGHYIEGTYNGLELCTFEKGTLRHNKHIPGINYSCQELAIVPDRYVWVSHAFKGISLFRLTENLDSLQFVKLFTKKDGLPTDYFNEIKLMNNGTLLATTNEGIYQFDFRSNMFIRSAYYNNLFQNKTVSYIQEDDAGNIWYICSNNEGGVLRFQEDGTYTNVTYPFYKLKGKFIGSFFHFNVLDNNNVLIALEKGFAHYNPSLVIDYRRKYNAVLNSVSYLNQSNFIYSGLRVGDQQEHVLSPEIDFKNNSLRFTFSGLFFEGNNETMFSYKMEGFDHDWSEWQGESVKEYTNLPDGDFTFRVRVKNKYGVIASPEAFHFTVLPPWYKSIPALLIYFAFFVILIWLIVLLFVKRIERTRLKEMDLQKRRYLEKEEKLKNEALLAEKEIIRLRNEKLRAEMIHKDKELANSAMNLVQKNKHLNKIKSELLKMKGEIKEDLLISRINMIIRKIDKETSNDESWSVFETNFEQVHEDFLKRLREKHPDITPKELKLSAYLRMNISSKEIATLLNITTRGVEISRYRLRKKFGLERNQNLIDYILSI